MSGSHECKLQLYQIFYYNSHKPKKSHISSEKIDTPLQLGNSILEVERDLENFKKHTLILVTERARENADDFYRYTHHILSSPLRDP